MKKVFGFLAIVFVLTACTESSSSTKVIVDSTVNKLDDKAEQVGEKAEEVWDSTKAKAKDLKEGLDETFDKKGADK